MYFDQLTVSGLLDDNYSFYFILFFDGDDNVDNDLDNDDEDDGDDDVKKLNSI
jgi:hypothetical protein